MANTIKWEAAITSRSTVLTTELNGLGIGAYSGLGSEIDNSTNLDQYGAVEIYLPSITVPSGGGYINVHMITAPGGTNYGDSGTPGNETVIATFTAPAATAAIRKTSTRLFVIPPTKVKFVFYNGLGVALAATLNTVTLYTCNDEIQ